MESFRHLEAALAYFRAVKKRFPDWKGNPFYLAELALAYRRLGSTPEYLTTLEQILALAVKD